MRASGRNLPWRAFPYPGDAYDCAGAKLKARWPRLHQGDAEPFPDRRAAGDASRAAELQQAWRLYHQGAFQQAAKLGADLGDAGHCVANKATAIYAHYLERDGARRLQLLQEASERARLAAEALPDQANAFYLRAYALGRYSQGYSVLKALAEGIGGTVKACLDQALRLQPKHADAHIALGTWHAEIIDKVGRLVGSLTYGANAEEAVAHYKKALALNPHSAIARVEYADGLLKLYGRDRRRDAEHLYREAMAIAPADAMERLDQELARTRLEEATA